MKFLIIANPETAPPTSLASAFLVGLAELIQTYPQGPHPDFPGYTSAPVGALARAFAESGAEPWHLGGFRFADGSVLRCKGKIENFENWSTLAPEEARQMIGKLVTEPLEVHLPHTFVGHDGREKRSVAEGCFVYQPDSEHWRLTVQYEAFMDSPLYELEANCFEELVDIGLTYLHIAAAQPSQQWRLEQIALHPDWVELLA